MGGARIAMSTPAPTAEAMITPGNSLVDEAGMVIGDPATVNGLLLSRPTAPAPSPVVVPPPSPPTPAPPDPELDPDPPEPPEPDDALVEVCAAPPVPVVHCVTPW